MLRAEIVGPRIGVTGETPAEMTFLHRILGAVRATPTAWTLPLTPAMCDLLRENRVVPGPALTDYAVRAARVRLYVEQMKTAEHVLPVCPPPIKAPYTMYQHQVRAYNIALALRSCALLLDMGTGKTLVAVLIAGRRFLAGKIKRLLIIAPTSVCPVWPAEFERFGDFPALVRVLTGDEKKKAQTLKAIQAPLPPGVPEKLRVAVVNYESCWRIKAGRPERDLVADFAPDMIILDESQRIKNGKAISSKAIHKLGDRAAYKLILTGTPIQKNTLDLWSQYRFLDPTIFPMREWDFDHRYARFGGFEKRQYMGPLNLEELTAKTHSIAYRVRKEDCLDLPEKMFEERAVMLEDDAAALYRKLTRDSIAELEGSEITANHVLTRLLRLQQMTGGFLADDEGGRHQVSSAKLDAARDIIEALCVDEGKKLVIFARFLPEVDALESLLGDVLGKTKRQPWVRIDGSVKARDRGGLVDRFQRDEDCKVFLGEIDACAEGLTLTASSTILYYSVNWNYAKYDQSISRIHRIGQTGTCTYIHLIVPHTIDEKIMRALHDKADIARAVVDNWRALISEN